MLDTIEKYDTITDSWTVMYFKLPKPLAKLGSVLLHEEAIFIAGGMSRDYEPLDEAYELNLVTLEWTQKKPMRDPRLPSSGLLLSQDGEEHRFVYAIGGNKSQRCERYNAEKEEWELIPSFQPKVLDDPGYQQNFLFTYSFSCSAML